jgi:hypothetical protein
MEGDEFKDIDHDVTEELPSEDDLDVELDEKKKKDLIDEDTESLEDLEDDELEEEEESFDDEYNQ